MRTRTAFERINRAALTSDKTSVFLQVRRLAAALCAIS
jgi:hypothetical protein